jgi:uncharacterized protein (DUF2267 family)
MADTNGTDLTNYYQNVQQNGNLLTSGHVQRWSNAVLWTLGLNLDRKTKKQLAKTLPEELADYLTRAFYLLHFRDKQKSSQEFFREVAKRSGNSDAQFAPIPTIAIFHEVKQFAGEDVSDKVAGSLAPEIQVVWEQA